MQGAAPKNATTITQKRAAWRACVTPIRDAAAHQQSQRRAEGRVDTGFKARARQAEMEFVVEKRGEP